MRRREVKGTNALQKESDQECVQKTSSPQRHNVKRKSRKLKQSPDDMGQKPSYFSNKNKSKIPLSWILRSHTTHNPNPEQPIKFQYKTRRKNGDLCKERNLTSENNSNNINASVKPRDLKSINSVHTLNNLNKANQSALNIIKNTNLSDLQCKIVKTQNAPVRTKSEPNLITEKREKHRHRRKSSRLKLESENEIQQFGYEIEDVDEFLAKASIDKPANIPVVLAFPSVLYQTRVGGYQAEISLPLGMVVNAVFKNEHWLYVQTPHAEEGYVSYAACLPLGIIPPPENNLSPCWENSTDVFPKPSGNMTDTEKLSSRSECSVGRCKSRRFRNAISTCGEKSVDRLYLRAAASAKNRGTRQTLLVITCDYEGIEDNTLNVLQGEVVALISTHIRGWFWVRNKEGSEGFIPAPVAGHGFL